MAHLRKQIRDNVVTALTRLSTTGSRVYASRVYPMAAANLPGLCVYARSEEVETTIITRPRTQARCDEKGGVADLEKARWYLDRLTVEGISS